MHPANFECSHFFPVALVTQNSVLASISGRERDFQLEHQGFQVEELSVHMRQGRPGMSKVIYGAEELETGDE